MADIEKLQDKKEDVDNKSLINVKTKIPGGELIEFPVTTIIKFNKDGSVEKTIKTI